MKYLYYLGFFISILYLLYRRYNKEYKQFECNPGNILNYWYENYSIKNIPQTNSYCLDSEIFFNKIRDKYSYICNYNSKHDVCQKDYVPKMLKNIGCSVNVVDTWQPSQLNPYPSIKDLEDTCKKNGFTELKNKIEFYNYMS